MNSGEFMQHQVITRGIRWCVMIVGALLVFTAGCAVRKPPSQKDIVSKALPNAAIPPTWHTSSIAGQVSNDWLKTFHDPQLDAIVSEAIANNLDLRQSTQRVEEARQTVIIVGAALKPEIAANLGGAATVTSPENSRSGSNMAYGVVGWEIDIWGKLRAQRTASEESYEATALDYAFARQSLAATAADSWYLAVERRQLLVLAQENVRICDRLLELSRVRRSAGKVADLDVAEANASLNSAQSGLRVAEQLYSEARRNLEVLIGRYPAAEIEISQTFYPLPSPIEAGLPSSLLQRRPDVIAAEREVQSAFHTKEAARLALYPNLSLNVVGGHFGDLLLAAQGLNPWLFHSAIGMFVPIYQGGALRAQVRIATAQQEQAVAHYGSVSLAAFEEVETALNKENLLSQRLPFEENAVRDRTEAFRLGEIKYRYGTTDLFSVLQLQQEQITQQIDLIKLNYALLGNRINLHLSLGGSFDASPAGSP